MANKLYHEYRFKFYLNASHAIFINGRLGQAHPHTWEYVLNILLPRNEFVEFNVFEKTIEQFFAKYQNQTMNKVEPFDTLVPTLENMAEYFGDQLYRLIAEKNGQLTQIECSETPTRSYIIAYEKDKKQESEYAATLDASEQDAISQVLDRVLDQMIP